MRAICESHIYARVQNSNCHHIKIKGQWMIKDGLKKVAQSKLAWLDEQMADGREFVAGSTVSLADVLLFGMLAFAANVGQPLNPEHKHVCAWFDRMGARPSAAA